jgi:Fe-S cluster assembly ATPase SufC
MVGPPPTKDSDPAVFHAMSTDNAAPQIHQFAGTVNLGFSIGEDKRSEINVSLLLESFMAFAKQTDGAFRIDPLNGSAQCITNPRNITATKEGV